jgi:hypothetical protein
MLASSTGVRTLLEPVQCCALDAPAAQMKELLDKRGFDLAGVMKDGAGPIIGFVVAAELVGQTIAEHMKSFDAEHLISDSTPIADLFQILRKRKQTFVLSGSQIKGIVTLADLSKPPVRIYLFGLLSLFEMHMRFWVSKIYGEDSWKEHLSDNRMTAANRLQAERLKRHEQIALIDCLQFCDKRDLLLAKEEFRTTLGIENEPDGEQLLKDAEDLRNKLAHSQQDLVENSSWDDLIDLIQRLEELVHRSDDVVEKAAKESARPEVSLHIHY